MCDSFARRSRASSSPRRVWLAASSLEMNADVCSARCCAGLRVLVDERRGQAVGDALRPRRIRVDVGDDEGVEAPRFVGRRHRIGHRDRDRRAQAAEQRVVGRRGQPRFARRPAPARAGSAAAATPRASAPRCRAAPSAPTRFGDTPGATTAMVALDCVLLRQEAHQQQRPRRSTRRSARSATTCGGGGRTGSRVRERACLPLADPHRFGGDDLEADPIAVQHAARAIDV